MALIVNLFGGPGAGKSTTAAAVFAKLKQAGINCELVREYAKRKVWEENSMVFTNQAYIFGKQFYEQDYTAKGVDVVITDSPIILSAYYNSDERLGEEFNNMVFRVFNSFNNLNVSISRCKEYNPKGRHQTEDEARGVDIGLAALLIGKNIPFYSIAGDSDAADKIVLLIKKRMEDDKK